MHVMKRCPVCGSQILIKVSKEELEEVPSQEGQRIIHPEVMDLSNEESQ